MKPIQLLDRLNNFRSVVTKHLKRWQLAEVEHKVCLAPDQRNSNALQLRVPKHLASNLVVFCRALLAACYDVLAGQNKLSLLGDPKET